MSTVTESTTLDALRRAILANPEDDIVRGAFADALDERNEPGDAERAAYIRWGCENPQNSGVCLCLNGDRQPQPCETCQLMGDDVKDIPKRADGETHYVVNRGFVSEIRLPLSTLIGGACERCRGTGWHGGRWPRQKCPACSGTGRTVGVLPGIVQREPVGTVRVLDREAIRASQASHDTRVEIYKRRGRDDPRNYFLEDEIYDRLEGGKDVVVSVYADTGEIVGQLKVFPTADAFTSALSAALLAWGKSR